MPSYNNYLFIVSNSGPVQPQLAVEAMKVMLLVYIMEDEYQYSLKAITEQEFVTVLNLSLTEMPF